MKKIFAFALAALTIFATSCVKDEQYKGPSKIETLILAPEAPTSNDAVTVTVTTSGLQSLQSAELTYNGQKVTMTVSDKSATGTIPAQPDKTNVKVKVTVTNSAGFATTKDAEYTVGNPPLDYTNLVINELNASESADSDKFLEFYNKGDFELPLKDITIVKNDAETVWTGIEGEAVPAKGFFVIKGVKDTEGRGISAGVSPKKSVKLAVIGLDGATVIDKIQHGKDEAGEWDQPVKITPKAGTSWSRIPDGTGEFFIATSTEGAKNATTGEKDDEVY